MDCAYDLPEDSQQAQRGGLLSLNYDVLLDICNLLPGDDIAHLLSSCHTLRHHLRNETIWRQLCQPYGLTDISRSEVWTSFYDAYTKVLHRYGPLIGLWASDHPYTGNVLEFRLDIKGGRIIGEIWRFPQDAMLFDFEPLEDMQTPRLPEYRTTLSIAYNDATGQTDIVPHIYAGQNWFDDATGETFVHSLHLLAETNEEPVLYHPSLPPSPLPPFPASDAVWHDRERELPRMPLEPSPNSSALGPHALLPRNALSMARGETTKPAALCIVAPAFTDSLSMYEPRVLLPDFRNLRADGRMLRDYTGRTCTGFHPRYYPLHAPLREGMDPAADGWDAGSLEGLWLGAYGPHGTEVLYVEHDASSQEVRAWKITGDVNVPRGAQTWKFRLDCPVRRHDDMVGAWVGAPGSRVYSGVGTVADTGFRRDQRGTMNITAAVIAPDQIRVHWTGMGMHMYTPRYRRYRRDLLAEEEVQEGIRLPVLQTPPSR